MITDYVPVLLQVIVAMIFAGASVGMSLLIGKRSKHSPAKDTPYECGKDPVGRGAARFSVKFYLVAMLFILFDIEVVFFYAWAAVFREQLANGPGIFLAMLPFVGLFFVGEYYALKKGALDWTQKPGRT